MHDDPSTSQDELRNRSPLASSSQPSDSADPGTIDFSGLRVVGGTTNYERWCCSIVANSCGFNDEGGLVGPTNDAFDLDQRNVVFTPVEGGFEVPEPESALLQGAAVLTIASLALLRRSCRKQTH